MRGSLPVGVSVGFIPDGGERYQPYTLVADDGGPYVYIIGNHLYILNVSQIGSPAQHPEGPLLIWRTEKEYKEWRLKNKLGEHHK